MIPTIREIKRAVVLETRRILRGPHARRARLIRASRKWSPTR